MDAVGNANALGAALPFPCGKATGGCLEQARTPREKTTQHRRSMALIYRWILLSCSEYMLFSRAVAIDGLTTAFPAGGFHVETAS